MEVRLNGDPTPVLNLTGVNAGISSISEVRYWLQPSGARHMSAWYLEDTTGGTFDDFLGHIRYAILPPTGNGNSSQLNGSDGNTTDNYLLVDDGFTHDSDTTYVQSDTVGNKDTYAFGSLPTTPLSIQFVSPVIIAKKTDAGREASRRSSARAAPTTTPTPSTCSARATTPSSRPWRRGPADRPRELGRAVGMELLSKGAAEIIARTRVDE